MAFLRRKYKARKKATFTQEKLLTYLSPWFLCRSRAAEWEYRLEGVEILYPMEDGYRPQVHFEAWRVAMLRYADRFDRKNLQRIERHHLTDEVFVLLEGEATLIIGEECEECLMEANKIYNVKKGVWHHIILSRDARVLIVENDNTGQENTEYLIL